MSAQDAIAATIRAEGWTCEYHEPVSGPGECSQCDASHERLINLTIEALADNGYAVIESSLVRELLAENERLAILDRAGDKVIASQADLLADLEAENERLKDDLDAAAYRAGQQQGQYADTLRALNRVQALADDWDTEPCVGGYRITNGNDDDSHCLHCAADIIRCAIDGEGQP